MWRGLIEAKRVGKVLNIGVMLHSRSEIENLINVTGETPSIVFVWYNPWVPPEHHEFVNWLQGLGITVHAYGLFNFKEYGESPELISTRVALAAQAGDQYGMTYGQFIIQWALSK